MRRSLVIVVMFLLASSAHACMVEKPLTKAEMNKADVVFIGRVISVGVPVCTGGCTGKPEGPHTITFDVEKVLKGKAPTTKFTPYGLNAKPIRQLEVYWVNGTFGEVDSTAAFRAKYGARSKVGIILPDTIKAHVHCGPTLWTDGNGKSETLKSCTMDLPLPFMPMPDSKFDRPWVVSDVCSPAYIFPAAN